MRIKISDEYLGKLFGYEKRTFIVWRKTATPELLARLEFFKLGAVLTKRGISTEEVITMADRYKRVEAKNTELKKYIKELKDGLDAN